MTRDDWIGFVGDALGEAGSFDFISAYNIAMTVVDALIAEGELADVEHDGDVVAWHPRPKEDGRAWRWNGTALVWETTEASDDSEGDTACDCDCHKTGHERAIPHKGPWFCCDQAVMADDDVPTDAATPPGFNGCDACDHPTYSRCVCDACYEGMAVSSAPAAVPDALREEVERLLDRVADLGIDTVNGPWSNDEMGDCGAAASAVRALLQASVSADEQDVQRSGTREQEGR